MIIDTSKLKEPYAYLDLNDGRQIQVKLDDEGIVIDITKDGEVEESSWKLYQEMIDGDDDEQRWAIFGDHPVLKRVDMIDITTAEKDRLRREMSFAGYGNIKVMTMEDWKIIKGKK